MKILEKISQKMMVYQKSQMYDRIVIFEIFKIDYDIPDNILNHIISNYNDVITCIKSIRRRVEMYTNMISYDSIIDKLRKRLDTFADDEELKTIYLDVLEYMININIIQEIYEKNYNTVDIDPELMITNLDKLENRINQKEAYDRLAKDGLMTGIHCQATGCGKTNIILHYIDYAKKKYGNKTKVILFTERVNILKDLFDFQNKKLEPSMNKLKKWKDLGIADLTDFNIINRVTIKKKDWMKEIMKSNKPTLLVINRAYLTQDTNNYNDLKNIKLVLHDECHNTSSEKCNDFLIKCKSYNVPIIGFSATPLRTGKDDKKKLINIYGDNKKNLVLLTNYNMIYAISQKLILPPEFYWYHIDVKAKNKLVKEDDMMAYEFGTVMELLHYIIPKLPNKKIVAWCGRIDHANKWKKTFQKHHMMKAALHGFKFYLDTSKTTDDEYEKFKKADGNCILFCANKHREGSDIRKLDCCMFLDGVMNRGCIPFIQSIGRVLRLDTSTPNKSRGIVIDGIYKNDEYEKDFVDKIIGYYMALQNLAEVTTESKSKYEQYEELKDIITFDKSKEMIYLNFNNNIININVNKLHWDDIVIKFDSILQSKIKLSIDDNMKHKGKILVNNFNFNIRTDFYNEYCKISNDDKIKYNLPDVDSEEYNKLFINKTWFDFLELDHNYYTSPAEVKKKYGNVRDWDELCKKDERVPPYPHYLWEGFSMDYFKPSKLTNNIALV